MYLCCIMRFLILLLMFFPSFEPNVTKGLLSSESEVYSLSVELERRSLDQRDFLERRWRFLLLVVLRFLLRPMSESVEQEDELDDDIEEVEEEEAVRRRFLFLSFDLDRDWRGSCAMGACSITDSKCLMRALREETGWLGPASSFDVFRSLADADSVAILF